MTIYHLTRPGSKFVLCMGALEPGDSHVHSNFGNGVFSQHVYITSGQQGTVSNGTKTLPLVLHQHTDISEFYGEVITYTNTSDITGSWIAINPLPDTKRFSCKLLDGTMNETLPAIDNDRYIVCVRGSIICNGVEIICNNSKLDLDSYGRVRKGKEINIIIEEGSAAFLLEENN